ncbi:MAG: helicase-related protein [Candidatus Heimdallarchaeota archaeon]|nr:helicase-related protein [Candidatus Heimdallarchaeota archaeon]MDH5646966.1 helicase-related protein [Candidatus Heimdallarchaeota archaeon]
MEHPLIQKDKIQSRIYQQIITTEAIKNNLLVVLPTGLGKTIIMVMVTAHILKKNPNSKIIITAPTKPLVNQHLETFRSLLNLDHLKINMLSGTIQPVSRIEIWSYSNVIICTPQVLRNDLLKDNVNLESVKLIIFDEVHRAVGDDPYVFSANFIIQNNYREKILGFTASPGNKDKIHEIMKNLYLNKIQYMDETHPQVKPYIHIVEEEWIKVQLPPEFIKIKNLLEDFIKNHLKSLKEKKIIDSYQITQNSKKEILSLPSKLNKMREELDDSIFFESMSSYGQLIYSYQALELLETQGLEPLEAYLNQKQEELETKRKKSLDKFLGDHLIKKVIQAISQELSNRIQHPKIDKLKQIIISKDLKSDTRILIFANYKTTINYLYKEISTLSMVRAEKFIGQNKGKYGISLSQKQQLEILEKFKSGELNVLISSSVGEEGLDVSQCDLVIFYDIVPSITRAIQRKGRTGRSKKGKIIGLITKDTRDESYYYMLKNTKARLNDEMRNLNNINQQNNLNNFFGVEKHEKEESYLNPIEKMEKKDQFEVYIDHREKNLEIHNELLKYDLNLIILELPVGDYVLSDLVAIERKSISDFCQSIINNTLFDQLIRLKNYYEKPLLILEGENKYDCSLSKNAIQGALCAIGVNLQIPIIQTKNGKESAEIIMTIIKKEQMEKTRPRIHGSKLGDSLSNKQLFLLSSLSEIDRTLAERILEKFEKPIEFLNADVSDMIRVTGIGKTKANKILEILHSTYPLLNSNN